MHASGEDNSLTGFTLIELIMVIVVLGALAAIAIPKFTSLQDSAHQAAADGSIGAMRTAISAYYAEQASAGTATFPSAITSDLFADGAMPTFSSPYSYSYDSSNGVVVRTTVL
ncbi:MAG: prepilin-type N-terminal cleavage/methylation domain-containing protein [Candidatus Omnitrophica bacterium]|nr:prepilin-type N-terminal cleavage/methylation domain-containing protein [Candidatus Omnitrophota bacterium]